MAGHFCSANKFNKSLILKNKIMKKIDHYDELAIEETLDFVTECWNTKSCAACWRRRECNSSCKNENEKKYLFRNNRGKAVNPPQRILQYIHSITDGYGFAKDRVIEIVEDGIGYFVSEDKDRLDAVATGIIEPDECYEFSTVCTLEN